MKPQAKNLPRALQMPKFVARLLSIFLLSAAFFVAGLIHTVCAAPVQDPVAQVRQLAAQGLNSADYAAAVAALVKEDPKDAEAIIAEAVKDEPKYACAVVKASLLALQPAGGTLDPKEVASIVVTIVQTVQASNPDIVHEIVSCALDVDPDAGPQILNALAGLFTSPYGPGRPPGSFGGVPPGTGHTPTPTPTPTPKAPTPSGSVTPYRPI
jgi:hypothetical protein